MILRAKEPGRAFSTKVNGERVTVTDAMAEYTKEQGQVLKAFFGKFVEEIIPDGPQEEIQEEQEPEETEEVIPKIDKRKK